MTDLHTQGFVNPMANPGLSNAQIAAMLTEGTKVEKPEISLPADGTFRLPGGLVLGSDFANVRYDAGVRELTGADEEAITKARQSSLGKFIATLLACGTDTVGDQKASPALLNNMLLGDRDMLLMEIRRATYGSTIEWDNFSCPFCGEKFHLAVELDEIPVRRMDDPASRVFEVPLRKGGKVFVRLPMGSDQEAILAVADRYSGAEQNTLLLSRVIISVVDKAGEETGVTGNTDFARNLGIVDRQAILTAITERQPGPQYNDVKFTHDACGKEVPLFISTGDLFQGL